MEQWELDLQKFKTDQNAGNIALKSAGEKYNQYKAAGQLDKAQKAHTWANQIRDAMGVTNYDRTTGAPLKQNTMSIASNGVAQPSFNYEDLINRMYEGRQSSQVQAITKQRDEALQGLNKSERGVRQGAYDSRNQADVVNMQNAKRLREMMADNGLFQGNADDSGANLTATANLNAQRQAALGDINLQEKSALSDIQGQRNLINNNAEADRAAIIDRLNAEKAGMMLDYGYKTNRDNIEDSRYDQQWNYQIGRDQVADKRYTEEMAYQKARDQIKDSQWKKQFDEDTKRWGVEFALQKQVQLGQLSISQANAVRAASNDQRQATIDERNRLMDIWEKTGIAPEGIEGVAAGTQLYNKSNPNVTVDYDPQKMNDEKEGLVQGLRDGKYSPTEALRMVQEDTALGFYTKVEAEELMGIIGSLGATYAPPQQANQDQLANLPSSKDLDQLWRTDPTGQKAGAALYDWKTWYSSPQGRLSGTAFDDWARVYGPKLG